ncbi:hypothetical protein ACOMHN_059624 [Nucella lapillus]
MTSHEIEENSFCENASPKRSNLDKHDATWEGWCSDPCPPSRDCNPVGTLVTGHLDRLMAVRLKKPTLELVRSLELVWTFSQPSNDPDPIGEPLDIRIRALSNQSLYMAVDYPLQKPEMKVFNHHPDNITLFRLQKFFSQSGKVCTLFHQTSQQFLAVDTARDEVVLHKRSQAPVCDSHCTDISLKPVHGAQPATEDEHDSFQLDPSCFFDIPFLNQPTFLTPDMCQCKSLSYDRDTERVKLVNKPLGEDFMIMPCQ